MTSWLDRPAARALALLIFLFCLGVLAFLHRDDAPQVQAGYGSQDANPVTACAAARFADIDNMVAEAVIDAAKAGLFKQRALAMCRDTGGQGG